MTAARTAPGRPWLFTSVVERRLWACALAVVVAIYATLGLASQLAGVLRARGVLEISFLAGVLVIFASMVAIGLGKRPGGAGIGVAAGVAVAYFMVFVRMATPEERTHLIEYGVVAALVYQALRERAANGRRVPVPALLAIGATTAVGALDEGIQWLLPQRVFDPRDLLFNALAGLMAVAASVALGWARRRRQ